MIKSITVTNYLGESLVLDLFNPQKSGLQVRNVTGLGPVQATVNTTEIPTDDGSIYNSSRLNQRNIVLSLGFLWDPLIEDTRHKTYRYFPLKRNVQLVVETDRRLAVTTGYVESNEPDIFSNSEGCSISIICPDPNFYAYGEKGLNRTPFYVIEPLFEFPFENESLTEPTLEFGNIANYATRTILYEGDEEVGITIRLQAWGEVRNIAFRNITTREVMLLDTEKLRQLTSYPIIAGDEIIISTSRGEKGAVLIRNGKTTNILNCINRNADWFKLSKGPNEFSFTAEEGRTDVQITIENRILYTGV